MKSSRSLPDDRLLDRQTVAGQGLAADDVAQVVGEMLEWREAAGFGVEIGEIEAPAIFLAAAMLAHEAIEPALEAAGQREIGAVDGEDERVIEDADVEPVGQDQLDAERAAVGVGRLLPFVDPGKAMTATLGRLPDRGRDGRATAAGRARP